MSVASSAALCFFTAGLLSVCLHSPLRAADTSDNGPVLQRDTGYEQALRYEASSDPITPQRVINWLFHSDPSAASDSPRAEFEPIVNVKDSHVRLIAAVAVKF